MGLTFTKAAVQQLLPCCCVPGVYTSQPKIRAWRRLFEKLGLNERDVGKFWRVFKKLDQGNDGVVQIEELLAYLDLDRTPFCRRLFAVFDADNSKAIDFPELVLALYNYCSQNQQTLRKFAFDLYDLDGSGSLTTLEVSFMLRELYGDDYRTNMLSKYIARELDNWENSGSRKHSFSQAEFVEYSRTHPSLLFHVFNLQNKCRRRLMGSRYWRNMDMMSVHVEIKGGNPSAVWTPMRANVSIRDLVGDFHYIEKAFIRDSRESGKHAPLQAKIKTRNKSLGRLKSSTSNFSEASSV